MRVFIFAAAAATAILAQTPSVQQGSVLNAASFTIGQPVTPGALVAIFGTELSSELLQASSVPLSTSLGNVSVTFNDVPAAMLFASSGQINAQLPWNVLPAGVTSGNANMVVRRGNASSAPVPVPVAAFSPGIFAVAGSTQAIAINPDGSLAAPAGSIPGLATAPTRAGNVLIILATGLGAVDNPVGNGEAGGTTLRTSTTTPTVLIGGAAAQVLFAGLTPQFPGVYQINLIVQAGVATGNAVSLAIETGGVMSNQTTIAVQ
ncbi:MAG: hypothetical protein ACRD44_01605 [Bryobacteraceae bacterium]